VTYGTLEGFVEVIKQSVFDKWQIEDKSVQAIITSPPYYSLRKYDIPDVVIGDWQGQYGLEPDYKSYLEHTMLWLKEAWRVLKDDGCLFVNIADSYCSSGGASRHKGYSDPKYPNGRDGEFEEPSSYPQPDVKPKSKLLIPERLMIMMSDAGWIIRNHLVWFKPNAMPESCQDRFSKKWESVIFATKQPRYYFDLDVVREKHSEVSLKRVKSKWNGHREPMSSFANMDISRMCHEKGKNPGDVWSINTQPSPEKHFAMWPEKLVERMILCSTKPGDVVLDPFCGSGTTLRVSDRLNREGIGIDLGYSEIQSRRLTEIQKELL
jgi:site-specific DNA-methyltransferase (cytosine-N4-specific)